MVKHFVLVDVEHLSKLDLAHKVLDLRFGGDTLFVSLDALERVVTSILEQSSLLVVLEWERLCSTERY